MLGNSFQRKLKILKNGGAAPLDVRHFIILASFTVTNEMFPFFFYKYSSDPMFVQNQVSNIPFPMLAVWWLKSY
jgi:hypothetical protein